jgi:predicted Zn-dependent protease
MLVLLGSDQEASAMGEQAFAELKKTEKVDTGPGDAAYVRCIIDPIIKKLGGSEGNPANWELTIFKNDDANAFALPGGKIGVFTGLFKVAQNDGQLATVLGHEIGHVIAKHGAERVSEQAGTQGGLGALGLIVKDNPNKDLLLGLLGAGVKLGVTLPFSRTQESEADLIGLDLMAKAGFDPSESVKLWQNMMAASGGSPPEWLSTHPGGQTRINQLNANMAAAKQLYNSAKAAGQTPRCSR